jgi:hypothetical protein
MRTSPGCSQRCAGPIDGAQDAVVDAAAAQMRLERRDDLAPRRRGIPRQQRRGGDEDARKAVAALAGLRLDEGLAQPAHRRLVPEALDGRHRAAPDTVEGPRAREGRRPVDQHHAGAALLLAAAEAGAPQAEMVAEHQKQRAAPVAGELHRRAVEHECVGLMLDGRAAATLLGRRHQAKASPIEAVCERGITAARAGSPCR